MGIIIPVTQRNGSSRVPEERKEALEIAKNNRGSKCLKKAALEIAGREGKNGSKPAGNKCAMKLVHSYQE